METKDSNFRTWKSGKTWLFASAAVAARCIGGGLPLPHMLTLQQLQQTILLEPCQSIKLRKVMTISFRLTKLMLIPF
ncbi:KxYKxGKxW signal peptide domain-containing protein [Lactococcus fujiensis]|uniref:KxYKxGKxW signal peptide domain-containing protein n=1 Tax=Lactococcus fujiensis TaxID=610251 RepID=UPI003570BB86